MNILATLRDRFASAIRETLAEDGEGFEVEVASLAELVLPSQDKRFGDYQANCAMPLGKKLGKAPREVAATLLAQLRVDDICETPEIAGPGFINLKVKESRLVAALCEASRDVHRLGVSHTKRPRTVILDYSSPNVAKPMHVGHIRSTVIGDALYRILRYVGHQTISDNHIGDWGTQFGMIIFGYKHFLDVEALREDVVAEMTRLYRRVNQLIEYHDAISTKLPQLREKVALLESEVESQSVIVDEMRGLEDQKKECKKAEKKLKGQRAQLVGTTQEIENLQEKVEVVERSSQLLADAQAHPKIGEDVLAETAKLHLGDPENSALWKDILGPCMEEIQQTYRRLGVTFNHTLGESFYHDRLAEVVEDLRKKGLAEESEGAICVFLPGYDAPMIVQKKDGAFLYATTDLATVKYRMEQWNPDTILYVVDHRQSLHFEQLFATVRALGYTDVELQHVSFGTVLGDDGKPYKTRSGSATGLTGLLDEAITRAHRIVSENDDQRDQPLLSDEERIDVATRVGIGAIKYADLSNNRSSDYKFSYDKMLAMTGNTAAYLQYSCARVKSIFARGGVNVDELRKTGSAILLSEEKERNLAMAILQFSEALDRVIADYRPNHLTSYLFQLASCYSEFFEQCPVLKAPSDQTRLSRLLLCDLTARTLETGLALLGIDVVERM